MKFFILFLTTTLFLSACFKDERSVTDANKKPFLKGELNAKYEGELTALAGQIMDIKPTRQKYPVYKLNLQLEGIKPIWVTSIAPAPGKEIKVGDMIIFKGYISVAEKTDSSGELEQLIQSKTLLMAIKSERPANTNN